MLVYPKKNSHPAGEYVRKGCDKLALEGNAKQRFWQPAILSPYKTATCMVSVLYCSHLGGSGEDKLTLLIPDE